MLVRKRLACALPSNHWSSTEYNSNNAWNVNFNNGNTNNNNKYNTNVVRAVAALDERDKEGWIEAYEDCCRHKKTSPQCTLYRLHYEEDLYRLALEVKRRDYIPSTSIAFVVTRPKLREIFAANFRDRIAQHWVTLRIEPLLERRFNEQGNVSFNCRKGFGTLKAVDAMEGYMRAVSDNYTQKAWVGRFDIKSFFMSIDVDILWSRLEPFIRSEYRGDDMEQLLWLTRAVIFHQPQNNCERRGDTGLWNDLPKSKSLFNNPPHRGMPIGNITSQLLANFYLSFFDYFAIGRCYGFGGGYVRFVDDFCVVAKDKEDILHFARDADVWLKENLALTMHRDKVYVQPVSHGVKFVGTVVMPHRKYLSNRTWGSLRNRLDEIERLSERIMSRGPSAWALKKLKSEVDGLNSLLGFTVHNESFMRRREYFSKLRYFWKTCYLEGAYKIAKIKKKYQYKIYCYGKYK